MVFKLKKSFKVIFSFLLAVVLTFGLLACEDNKKSGRLDLNTVYSDITNSLNGKKLKYDVRNLEYLVTNVFDKLIQFLGELKFDYLNSKEQNMKFLTENISRNANLSDNMASMNAEVSKMQRKVNEQDEIINRLESENNLLKCQIELIEKKSHQ